MYSNRREECANLPALAGAHRRSSRWVWGDQKDVQLPGTRTILCIDEDDGMLSCKKGWLRENWSELMVW